uniref:Peptidase S1 domain-containing protein n=1 Tax=Panagrolaimus sp. JU765 TaxID=591449 RepID=A0AC34Q837_9BILA
MPKILNIFQGVILLFWYVSAQQKQENCGISPNLPYYKRVLNETNPEYQQMKILGGIPSKETHWPWAGYLDVGCTAVIIHPRWALTAMHCFAKYGTRLEYHSVDKTPHAYKTFKVYVDQVITPDDSCRKLPEDSECFCCRNQDIALLHLTEDLEFDEKVGKICLSNDLEEKEETGRVVIGWGVDPMKNATTNILQEVVVPIQDPEEFCGNNTHEKEICAGGLMKGTGKGDSGGPLMMIKNDKWFLHGITSRGDYNHTESGMIKDRASYTDVTKWVRDMDVRPLEREQWYCQVLRGTYPVLV